ncbi:MAG: PKD domain-containing protein, partial [Archaeoglobaceae archaeon]
MKARIAILLVVVAVVIGAAVLPSVFAGMTKMTFTKVYDIYDYFWVLEDMYATDRVDLNISGGCAGCHGAIQDQLNTSSIHSDFSCEECHKITKTSSGEEIEYSNQTHDLTIPRCLDCHGGNGIYSNDTGVEKQAPTATGFNESGYGTNSSAHKKFVEESLNFGFSKGENEACVSCHTNQLTEVTYKYFWNIEYSIEGWRISSLTYNGTREHTSNYTGSEEKHVFLSKNEVDCVGCHQNVYDTLVYGTNGTDEDYLSHAPIEINTNGGGTGWGDKNDCWNHLRYHYASNRAQNVNTEYCIECHKVDRYAEINGSDYYNLQAVINDTNSTSVHAAESLSCGTCHGSGKTKEVTCANHNSKDFVEHVSSTYARTVVGDICMGCHQAAVHPDDPGPGCNCHTSNTYVESVYIESEPSGLACNSRGKPCPTGPEAYFEWTPLYPQPNESVEFNASDSTDDGTIESYKWEFGDGNSTTVS